ncbi:hypothetical protein AZE42_11720 [Rhizopogon vesiculosus]|uniref:Uncharacterized protein n=1 Tax=Rhizopogon vesiculosus TaxID=180088 RepID=A0A1J8QYH0_9AGAM|nr:hypothetical protein AZE42_11720 [Rhizopogon vesiculosus]
MTLGGHEPPAAYDDDLKFIRPTPVSMSYFPGCAQTTNGSGDKTVRRWDLQSSKEIDGGRIVYMPMQMMLPMGNSKPVRLRQGWRRYFKATRGGSPA